MSKLLIDDRPVMVLPKLAEAIGLNKAIVLQQLHYWLVTYKEADKAGYFRDGEWWVYNTKADWQENFPWWSESTVWRTLVGLRKDGLIKATSKYNHHPYDRTLWYTIDRDALAELEKRLLRQENEPQSGNNQLPKTREYTPQSGNNQLPKTREYIDPTQEDTLTQNGTKDLPKAGSQSENNQLPKMRTCTPPRWDNEPRQNGTIDPPNMGSPIPETSSETNTKISSDNIAPSARKASPSEETAHQNEESHAEFARFFGEEANRVPPPRRTAEDVRRGARDAMAAYARNAHEWESWHPDRVHGRGGVSRSNLQRVGWMIEKWTGLVPRSDPVWARWRPVYEAMCKEATGEEGRIHWEVIDQAIKNKWPDDPKYRTNDPAKYVLEVQKLMAGREGADRVIDLGTGKTATRPGFVMNFGTGRYEPIVD